MNFYKQANNLINSFFSKENDVKRLFIVILITFLSGFKSFFLGLNDVTSLGLNLNLQDPFHFGEFFAASMGYVFSSQTSEFSQYTIHGTWDILPTIISLAFFGKNHFFFPTRVIIYLCSLLSCFILITISWKLIHPDTEKKLEKFIFILVMAFCAPIFVNIRDLFLLISIFLFLECMKSKKNIYRFILEALLGLSLAFGIFWSFNRGIVGIGSLGVPALYCLLRYRRFVLTAFSGILSIVILQLNALFSMKLYLENLKLLSSTSYMWSYGFDETFKMSIVATLFNISALVCLIIYSNLIVSNKLDRIALVISICILSLLMLKIGTNRAAFINITYSLWVPYLIFGLMFHYISVDIYKKYSILNFSYLFGLVALILLFVFSRNLIPLMMCIALAGQAKVISNTVSARIFYQWLIIVTAAIITLQSFSTPILKAPSYVRTFDSIFRLAFAQAPPNNSLVDQKLLYAAQKLSLSKDECIFDLSNHGMFNGILFLPPCTRFSYPVYADRSYQKTMISDLQKSSPSSIIYSSDHWSYKIDNKSMVQRLPELDNWIVREYPIEECVPSYCIRRKSIKEQR